MPDVPDPEHLVVEALHALSEGEAGRARALLEQAEARAPGDRDVLLLKATLLVAEDDAEAALEVFDQALQERGQDPVVSAAKAALLLDVYDDPQAARPLLEAAAEQLVDEGAADRELLHDVLLRLSECRGRTGDLQGALEAACEASDLEPGSAEALLARAAALLDLGHIDDTRALVEAVLDVEPDDARATSLKGAVLDWMGDRAAADHAHARAAVLDPEAFAPPSALDPDAFLQAARQALADAPEPLDEVLGGARVEVQDLPAPGELSALSPPRPHGCLGVLHLFEGGAARAVFYRRAFERLGIGLEEVPEVCLGVALDELERLFPDEGAPEEGEGGGDDDGERGA